MRTLIILFLVFLNIQVFSQTAIGNAEGGQTLIDLRDNFATYIGLQPKSEGLIGTPFLFNDLREAQIKMITDKKYQNVRANILAEKGELYVEIKPNNIVVPDISYIESITFIEDSTVFIPFQINNKKSYAQKLLDSEGDLYVVFFEKKLVKANVGGAYNTGSKFDEYKEVITYFHFNDDIVTEIKKNNNGLKYLGGGDWKDVRDYVKNENIDFNIPSDMLKVIQFARKL
jgi:hypothetical protein